MNEKVAQRLSRRQLMAGGAGAASLFFLGGPPRWSYAAPTRFASDPFALGVASGDPLADGIVLWTRLAPDPLAPDGGMQPVDHSVRWELALDQRFRRVVRRGETVAPAALAHSVHVEADGLRPDREYFYRFRTGGELSPVGRTRTLPAAGSRLRQLSFAFASCQRFEHGYFTAYRDLADDEELAFVLHVGDYIYENPISSTAGPRAPVVPDALRAAATDLAGYRLRHALYKTDPDLQRAHAAFPWLSILDNHDAVWDGDEAGPRDNLARRTAAYQAWYEHMPWRAARRPEGPNMRIYRNVVLGDLAELRLLDTRQFKDDEDVCAPDVAPPNLGARCAPVLDPGRTMLGPDQERWLLEGLRRSHAHWNVLAQTILMAPFDFTPGPGESYYLSGWDGYPANRRRLLDELATEQVANPIVLSGDWHTSWVNDLPRDPAEPGSDVIATEFLCTSISSDTGFTDARSAPAVPENPIVRYYDNRNGYARCTLDRNSWRTDFLAVGNTDIPASPVTRSASWLVEAGRRGAEPA